jgi:hypothetical protein
LRFARYIIRIQRQIAIGIKETFIAHLKLKGLYKQYKIRERHIHIELNVPTSFMALREQEILEIKFNNYQTAVNTNTIAPSYAQKYYLGLTDALMKENREWQKKDAALRWELSQIENVGPDFREQARLAAGGGGAEGGSPGSPGGLSTPIGEPTGQPTSSAANEPSPGASDIPEFGGASVSTGEQSVAGNEQQPSGATDQPA